MAREGFNADRRDAISGEGLKVKDVAGSPGYDQAYEVNFPELQRAPPPPAVGRLTRAKPSGVKGEYLPGNDRLFTLVRYRMNCCARDAVALKAVIMLDPQSKDTLPQNGLQRKWVQVEGQVQFQQDPSQPGNWVTIIVLRPDADHPLIDAEGSNEKALIKVVKADENYYLY